jgi:putative transposase
MLQTYKFSSNYTNVTKLDSIRELGKAYKIYYNNLMPVTLSEFYKQEGKIPKFLPRIQGPEKFSERYKQTCGKQVRTNLNSWLENIKNRFREKITHSNLPENSKIILYTINKYGMWFKKDVKIKGVSVPPEFLKLSRKIFKHCRGNYPKLRNITLNLDEKVALIEKPTINTFDYWIKLSTLNKSHPIYLPIKSYDYYENKKGALKKQIQIIIHPDKIEYGFVKDVAFKPRDFIKDKIIGLDTGVVIPLSTSTGNQYGQGLYGRLKGLDVQITRLTQMRRKNGLYKNSPKVNHLYNRARSLLKNEIGRITNEFLKTERPEEIILENNKDILEGLEKFSPRMRRIIKNSGITRLRDTLIMKSARDGSSSSKVNQAYTSQECPMCHCVDSKNRTRQKNFKCIHCDFTRNADYVASINIRNRRSIPSISIYTPYKKVRGLLEEFYKKKDLGASFRIKEPFIVGPGLTNFSPIEEKVGMTEEG